jgi:ATP dependent DNA ligase domain
MLARSGRLPASGDYSYDVKWDGFRAIVSTEGTLRVRSRRGWDMTPYVTFLAQLPVRAVLDGELVALDADGGARLSVDLRVPRTRGRRREATPGPLPARAARLDQDEESLVKFRAPLAHRSHRSQAGVATGAHREGLWLVQRLVGR